MSLNPVPQQPRKNRPDATRPHRRNASSHLRLSAAMESLVTCSKLFSFAREYVQDVDILFLSVSCLCFYEPVILSRAFPLRSHAGFGNGGRRFQLYRFWEPLTLNPKPLTLSVRLCFQLFGGAQRVSRVEARWATHRLHSSCFLGLPYRILNSNHKKEL